MSQSIRTQDGALINLDDYIAAGVAGLEDTASGTHSHQTVAADLTLDSAAGNPSDTSFFAAGMFNLFGDALTRAANYLAGVIGMYSVTGSGASTYPKGAV